MSKLSAGRNTDCDSSLAAGGISDAIYLANESDVTSIQLDADGKCSGITMEATKVFYPFDFKDETGSFKESLTNENDNVVVDQTFEMIWRSRNHPDRNAIMNMACNRCGMVAIHVEMNDVAWIWGYNSKRRVKLRSNEGVSGAALGDSNQESVTLGCKTNEKAIEFTPGAAGIPL